LLPVPTKAATVTSAVHTTDYFVIEPSRNCPIAGYLIVKQQHIYEVRPRKNKRAADLICDALPIGRLFSR
jgi:hypothetical protein